jgi:phosphoribosyl-dephospho-CoA transferase
VWQHLSGIPYLTPASDVDLLVRPRDAVELRSALALLAASGPAGAPRLDGEVQLPDGRGVAWRELAARPDRVLVKSARGVALERTGDWLGPLAGGLS